MGCTKCDKNLKCTACDTGYELKKDKDSQGVELAYGTCSKKACLATQYFDADTKSCSACPTGCEQCTQKGVCLACKATHLRLNGGKTCLVCAGNDGLIASATKCTEKCGDGKHLGAFQCDDGNNENGDGCDSQC